MKGPLTAPPDSKDLTSPTWLLAHQIQEWHFHVYFDISVPNHPSRTAALKLRDAVIDLNSKGHFTAVPYHINTQPTGPHTGGSYEVWVPASSFVAVFSFINLNRGELSVLVHPLTRHEVLDHSERAVWMGESKKLKLEALEEEIPEEGWGSQYPDLGLGYADEEWRRRAGLE